MQEKIDIGGAFGGAQRSARAAMFDKRGTGMSDKVDALPGMDDVRAVMDAVG